MRKSLLSVVATLVLAGALQAQTTLSAYRQTDEKEFVYQIEGRTKAHGFDYYGYIDFSGERDPSTYFLRSMVSRPIEGGFLAEIMVDDWAGPGNEVIRAGVVKGFKFADIQLYAKFFPFETDESGQFACLVFSRKLGSVVSFSGYLDRHINNGGGDDTWVFEPQVELRVFDRVQALLEYRLDERRDLDGFFAGIRIE